MLKKVFVMLMIVALLPLGFVGKTEAIYIILALLLRQILLVQMQVTIFHVLLRKLYPLVALSHYRFQGFSCQLQAFQAIV